MSKTNQALYCNAIIVNEVLLVIKGVNIQCHYHASQTSPQKLIMAKGLIFIFSRAEVHLQINHMLCGNRGREVG